MNNNEEEEDKGQEENERVRVKSGDFRFFQCCHAILIQLRKPPPLAIEINQYPPIKKDKAKRVKTKKRSLGKVSDWRNISII